MTSVVYTAVDRSDISGTSFLVSGHVAGTSYTLDFDSERINPSMTPVLGGNHKAISGEHETILQRIDSGWEILTEIIEESAIENWREFHASVAAGETFTFDAYGTSSSPDNQQTVRMIPGSWRENRVSTTLLMRFGFSVEVAA